MCLNILEGIVFFVDWEELFLFLDDVCLFYGIVIVWFEYEG